MNGGMPPAQGRLIHDVIMQEREIVKDLYRQCTEPGLLLHLLLTEKIATCAQERPDPLATQLQDIGYRII